MPTGSQAALIAQGVAATLPGGGAPSSLAVKTEVPIDHRSVGLQSQAAVAGVMSVVLPAAEVTQVLKIERIGVFTNSTQPTVCTVYVGDAEPQNQADYTPEGDQDQADESNPILVPGGQPLTIQWTGASAGAVGFARIQYTLAAVIRGTVGGSP